MPRPDPERLRNLIRDNARYYINWLISSGHSLSNAIMNAFGRPEFGGLPPSLIQGEAITAQRMSVAGGTAGFNPSRRVSNTIIPINPNLDQQYRFVATVRCASPDGSEYFRTVVIDSPSNLSFVQLDPTATSAVIARHMDGFGLAPLPADSLPECGLYRIDAIERKS